MTFSSRSRMSRAATFVLGAALTSALIANPVLAQSQDRPSRQCMREVRDLCAAGNAGSRPDREQLRACLAESSDELSSGCSAELQERAQQRRGARGQRGERGGRGERSERAGRAQRNARPYQAAARVTRTVIYGDNARQQIDVYEPADAVEPLPLVLFIHGGAWTMGSHKSVQAKPAHFGASGYYFASAGYRLVPGVTVEEQAADIGAAITALRGQAGAIGFDPDRIVLMGHSAGAHLAALVGADPSYAGDAFGAIRGVILLDSGAYDIPARIAAGTPRTWQLYTSVFGSEAARQLALSPITHVGSGDAPQWLALYVEEREAAREQSQMLANALIAEGVTASALPITDTDHGRMNREIGTQPGGAQTEAIDAFLEAVF